MTPDKRIQIIEWLMQREMLLARVHDLEQEINGIFGAPYPLEAPDLPSRRVKKAKPKNKAKPAKAWKPPTIRRLKPGENVYRIDFIYNDTPLIEYHNDPQLLKTFLATRLPGVEVLSISAGAVAGEEWQEYEVLYTLPDTDA